MNNIDKLHLSLGLVKQARISLGMLRTFLGKSKPLFHGINSGNQAGLLKMPKALSGYEAVSRNLANNVESLSSNVRNSISNSSLPLGVSYNNNVPNIRFDTLAKKMSMPAFDPSDIAKLKYEGPLAEYARIKLQQNVTRNMGLNKNWGNISFKESTPLKSYGDFGVVTTPNRVTGGTLSQHNKNLGPEILAHSKFNLSKDGLPDYIELPQASGKIYYYPTKENANFSRELIGLYGRHNVIPINAANINKLKTATRGLQNYSQPVRYDAQLGDRPISYLAAKYPGLSEHIDNTKSWLSKI